MWKTIIATAAAVGCGLLAWGGSVTRATAQVPRPNIVIMLADDQRWDAFGVVQREQGTRGRFPFLRDATPNLDRLAAEGYRFRNAFVVSSLCSPSRAAFLTGRYNHLNGVANNQTPFPVTSTTYATLLRAAGYRTGYFGKWHMGGQTERPGFDRVASYLGQGRYHDALFIVDGIPTQTTGWVDDVSTDHATAFIRDNVAAATGPFLAVLGFKSPHTPTEPAARHRGLFTGVTLAPAPNATAYPPYDPTPQPPGVAFTLGYFRTLVGIDENVGRVLDLLDETGIADDTIVIYASDNGYFLGEHGITGLSSPDGNKRNAYEESMRIPLLLRYPRLAAAGTLQDAQVLNIDLAPTLLDLAGLPPPASMQGKSWRPLLTGTVARLRSRFLYEYFHEAPYIPPTMVALRRGDHKLIRYPGRPAWRELFDLRADPYERRNLFADPASQGVLRIMRDALDAEIVATGYQAPAHADRPR
jgi:arylsulfatase A-like enzyme